MILGGELAQVDPGVATLTTLYTVASNEAVEVVITICNRGAATTFRLSLAIAAAADALTQYKFYDTAIGANTTIEVGPYRAAATDRFRCYATLGTLTFTVNGLRFL